MKHGVFLSLGFRSTAERVDLTAADQVSFAFYQRACADVICLMRTNQIYAHQVYDILLLQLALSSDSRYNSP